MFLLAYNYSVWDSHDDAEDAGEAEQKRCGCGHFGVFEINKNKFESDEDIEDE